MCHMTYAWVSGSLNINRIHKESFLGKKKKRIISWDVWHWTNPAIFSNINAVLILVILG